MMADVAANNSDKNFHNFHCVLLPKKLRGANGLLAAQSARELVSLCLRRRDSDSAYTYIPRAATIEIVAGTEGEITVEIEDAKWQSFVESVAFTSEMICPGTTVDSDETIEGLARWTQVLNILYG